jgi:hypothetical protein
VATWCREFPNSKRAGRNASEPTRSLVNELEEPTLWSEGEGRWMDAEITEVASIDFRGSRGRHVLEDLLPSAGDPLRWWGDHRLLRIRKRKRNRP